MSSILAQIELHPNTELPNGAPLSCVLVFADVEGCNVGGTPYTFTGDGWYAEDDGSKAEGRFWWIREDDICLPLEEALQS